MRREVRVGDRVDVWLSGYGDQCVHAHATVVDRWHGSVGFVLDNDGPYGHVRRSELSRVTPVS